MEFNVLFPENMNPQANEAALVQTGSVRITLLTEHLIRLEFDPAQNFEERASQAFWNRDLPVPNFGQRQEDGKLILETERLRLEYTPDPAGFTADTLQITLLESGAVWHFGDAAQGNLLGTARTLDETKGALQLEQGLLSRQGWVLVDDSDTLVFNQEGWLEPREEGKLDLYFFGHGLDYQNALDDFCKLSGPAPLVPRWMLGNWWSRYWAYSQDELLGLMSEFEENDVPLSVCIVDMDWHLTQTGNRSNGWTGYTWNKELFPDPEGFLAELHKRGLKTALNLHPAEGVHAHEEMYADFARRMGEDPQKQKPIKFNISDPRFTQNYFELLHHPQEQTGVDFWWLDWQQGEDSGVKGLDPLWWLNHLHYIDLGREGKKRPVIFSRWGGLGNHRYPIGFSGDTIVSWEALRFQPWFTSTAANVNYGWWSHDIGGHMAGLEDAELYTRWVQFGIFSPIFRLHCTNNPFHERRPWGWDKQTEQITTQAMRFRQRLIPYLYSMNQRNTRENKPLVRPMYQAWPQREEAYHCPDQYLFGSELLAAPYLQKAEESLGLSRGLVWLPDGVWFDLFKGTQFPGENWLPLYGKREDLPIFARAGAVIPLAREQGWSDTAPPEKLELLCFPGADHSFTLVEDDGLKQTAETLITQQWSEEEWRVTVHPPQGESSFLPQERSYLLTLRGICAETQIELHIDGKPAAKDCMTKFDPKTRSLYLDLPAFGLQTRIEISFKNTQGNLLSQTDWKAEQFEKILWSAKIESWAKMKLQALYPLLCQQPEQLSRFEAVLSPAVKQALYELFFECGAKLHDHLPQEQQSLVLWCNSARQDCRYLFSLQDQWGQPRKLEGSMPAFGVIELGEDKLRASFGSALRRDHISIEEWIQFVNHPNQEHPKAMLLEPVQLILSDHEPGEYVISAQNGCVNVTPGRVEKIQTSIRISTADWLALINNQAFAWQLMKENRVSLKGNMDALMELGLALNPAFMQGARIEGARMRVICGGEVFFINV